MTALAQQHDVHVNARVLRLFGVSVIGLLLLGPLFTDNPETFLSYSLVLAGCVLPSALWLMWGSHGIPVLPALAGMYFLYYAVPILRENGNYRNYIASPEEILNCGILVSLFLFSATATWAILVRGVRSRRSIQTSGTDLVSDNQLGNVIISGLAFGILYYVAIAAGGWDVIATYIGTFRSILLSSAAIACFLLGYAKAKGAIRGQKLVLALIGISVLVAMELASLFLVLAMIHVFSALLGYAITARRIPWRMALAALAILALLQAGKVEMREKYWLYTGGAGGISITDAPAVVAEWLVTGAASFGDDSKGPGIIDRASLLTLLARVQRVAPDHIPFLNGESYALLPAMLVPRFLSPDKISSQASMALLNVYFEFQTAEDTERTAIGWGPVAEAYGNFGRLGVIGIGLVFGLMTGFLTRWSVGHPIVSLPSLVSIDGMISVLNAESDFSYLIVNFSQSAIAIAVFYLFIREFIATRKNVARSAS